MAYAKTVWKNRIVEKPGTGTLQQNADGTVTFIAKEGNIIEAGTPVNAENMNKIEDTLAAHDAQLAKTVSQTTADIIYYVATNGSDTNNGLTSATAFKTIAHAISLLPQVINANVKIIVAPGTYNENVEISGFVGKGMLTLEGSSAVATTHNIISLVVKNCTLYVYAKGFNTIATGSNIATLISGCTNCSLGFINSTGASSMGGIHVTCSRCSVMFSTISNKLSAIYATGGSTVNSYSNQGSGNTYGLYANDASTIGKGSTQPTGLSANEYTTSGGVIR